MKSKVLLLVAGLAAFAVSAQASDVTGKWVAQVPGREGQTREQTFTFKMEGDKLTGTTSGRQGDTPISDAKIAGDEISFVVTMNMQGNEMKMNYKGKITGDEMKLTRTAGDRPAQEFTAKRAPK